MQVKGYKTTQQISFSMFCVFLYFIIYVLLFSNQSIYFKLDLFLVIYQAYIMNYGPT